MKPYEKKNMNICFVTPYPPRECGIANYSGDLVDNLRQISHSISIKIAALTNKENDFKRKYSDIFFDPRNIANYDALASVLNNEGFDLVHIQHEFGLYGGFDGEYILRLSEQLKVPFVTTFHTVLSAPNLNQLRIVKEIAKTTQKIFVMAKCAKKLLHEKYKISLNKIVVVHHGVLQFENKKIANCKEQLSVGSKFLLSTYGLISQNKGIEYIIEAIPEIVKKIPSVLFLVIGKTHPTVIESEGEVYRNKLESLVGKYQIGQYVKFVNKYLTLEEIKNYLGATDIYVTPYLEAQQVSSGTLAYAIGAGKPCISTPYLYASEALCGGGGVLVPFRDSKAIASAVTSLSTDKAMLKSMSERNFTLGKEMAWLKVAGEHMRIYKEIVSSGGGYRNDQIKFWQSAKIKTSDSEFDPLDQ